MQNCTEDKEDEETNEPVCYRSVTLPLKLKSCLEIRLERKICEDVSRDSRSSYRHAARIT